MKKINCKNVLFINYGGIGDEVLFLPTIEAFKKLYPESKITLCLEKRAEGIKNLSNAIDDIITVDIKAKGVKKYLNILKLIVSLWFMGFDTVISSGKSPFVSIILFLSGIKTKAGYKTKTSKLLTFEVPLNENCYAGNMYFDLIKPFGEVEFELPNILYDKDFPLPEGVSDGEFILIHPGVSLMSIKKNIFKCPDVDFWNDVIQDILNMNKTVLLAGGPDDKEIIEKILSNENIKNHPRFYSMFNKTKNLYEMAGLINKAGQMISADSAPLHFGVALKKDIIVLFGPTNEEKLVPKQDNIKVITNKNISCRPCLWHKRTVNCKSSKCLEFKKEDLLNCVK